MLPKNFFCASTSCGIRKGLDLSLIWSNDVCCSAAVFTKNAFKAAPVKVCQQLLIENNAHGVVINAGNANAVTGAKGYKDALKMSNALSKPLFVLSTGVIGKPLPIDKIMTGIKVNNNQLASNESSVSTLAKSIMTTDTKPKYITKTIQLETGAIGTITGIAKGAGMIHPNMATMLGCVLTDCKVPSQNYLQTLLNKTSATTFNTISVDGDTSTNDTLLAMSNNQFEMSQNDLKEFEISFTAICDYLSTEIVKDGEGATKLITLHVSGLSTNESALNVARFVSTSPLVKTAIFGRDANWGRLFSSAGSSPELMDTTFESTEGMTCSFMSSAGEIKVFNGTPLDFDEDLGRKILSEDSIAIHLHLNQGNGSAKVKFCDFSPEYVNVNASYRS